MVQIIASVAVISVVQSSDRGLVQSRLAELCRSRLSLKRKRLCDPNALDDSEIVAPSTVGASSSAACSITAFAVPHSAADCSVTSSAARLTSTVSSVDDCRLAVSEVASPVIIPGTGFSRDDSYCDNEDDDDQLNTLLLAMNRDPNLHRGAAQHKFNHKYFSVVDKQNTDYWKSVFTTTESERLCIRTNVADKSELKEFFNHLQETCGVQLSIHRSYDGQTYAFKKTYRCHRGRHRQRSCTTKPYKKTGLVTFDYHQ